MLDDAGWRPGSSRIREKDGARASFELLYNAQDTLRRDLAVAFAAAMQPLGIEVRPRGTSWDEIDTRFGDSAVLLGGGATPYSIDSQVYDTLHTRVPDSSPYSNPGNFTAPGLDDLLERAARVGARPRQRRAVPRHPGDLHRRNRRRCSWCSSTTPTPTATSAGSRRAPILEPHSHGVTWGPWWNVAAGR